MSTAQRCGIAAFVLGLCAAAQSPAAPTIAEFATHPEFRRPTLSPDGTIVAFVTRVQGTRFLLALDLVKKQRTALIPASIDTFDLSWCRFKTNERLLCGFQGTAFDTGQPYAVSRLLSVDVTGKTKPKLLIQNGDKGDRQFQDRILDWQIDDPKHVLIELAGESGPFPNVHALDIKSGLLSVVQRVRTPVRSWLTDRKGIVRFGEGSDERRTAYITRDSADMPWRTLGKWELGQSDFDVIGFGPTPATLLVSASHNGRDAIFEMDLTEKSDRQLLFANSEVDVRGAIHWPTDKRIVGFTYETDRLKRTLFDQEAADVYAAIDTALPGADNTVIDASRDGNQLLIESVTDVRPSDYLVLDRNEKKLRKITSENAELAKTPLSPMKPVKIKGPDGIMLPGYLTLPLGSDGKKVPLIVYPHGGPHYRDRWGFDEMVQFMASRGFAVLQVNFRGSVGYGYEWYKAGLRNWGTVMVDDITAATRWAIAEGIGDPAHTCIVGWSYGGYAALMSVAREPDLYRCAVSIAGVADLRALQRDDSRFYGGRQAMETNLGTDSDELKANSPLRAANRIKVPVLMVHGDQDIQVLVDHSRRMARALDSAKIKNELVIIKKGDHSLSRYEYREILLTKLEAFLAANN
jgi:dipeptidyl aminopeptidase/acylaminoacyl peptidase